MTSINQSIDQLSLLRLNGFIEALQNQAQDPAYNALPFNDRLAHLISAELLWAFLMTKMLEYLVSFCLFSFSYGQSINKGPTKEP